MKKKLDEQSIMNELKGYSGFFKPVQKASNQKRKVMSDDTVIPRHRDTKQPRYQATVIPHNHDTVIPRHRDTKPASEKDSLKKVCKAVQEIGKEAATHRFTVNEKRVVSELIYGFRKKQIRTSENEITRIALNYLIENYEVKGAESILEKVFRELKH
jgi:hypothetical protein